MAGIEQLEIHSKSYIVRWAKVDQGYTISWSVQPHKKSINFGIVKHPGTGGTNLTTFQTDLDDGSQPDGAGETKAGLFAKKDADAQEQLRKKGFRLVKWHGKCDADKVSTGTYEVQPGDGGMFGLVFDNTFSKQTSKSATFVLLTYPTGAAPQPTQNLASQQTKPLNTRASKTSLARTNSPRLAATESVDSLGNQSTSSGNGGTGGSNGIHGGSNGVGPSLHTATVAVTGAPGTQAASANYHVGTLLKRRRKRGQGYARRFFSLDYATCTLSYYYNRNSSALRGAIPLSLAAIAADERRREITIDSGAEVWHLKASNVKEFTDWARALERAGRSARGLDHLRRSRSLEPQQAHAAGVPHQVVQAEEERREWQQVETLVSRVVGTRDALRRLVKNTAAQQYLNHGVRPAAATAAAVAVAPAQHLLSPPMPTSAAVADDKEESLAAQAASAAMAGERRSFWRRKSSASPLAPATLQPAMASALAVPTPASVSHMAAADQTASNTSHTSHTSHADHTGHTGHDHGAGPEEDTIHGHCQALLDDLDSVVAEFTRLLATSKQRRVTAAVVAAGGASASGGGTGGVHNRAAPISAPRRSLDSTASDEFFDAAEGESQQAQLLRIDAHSEAEDTPGTDADEASLHERSSVSSAEVEEEYAAAAAAADADGAEAMFPAKPKSLAPLPIPEAVRRRATIPPATVAPPSLIAFVRKNVGKDLSTISMPASANEPTSMLQRVAEQLEYAQLLDAAVTKGREAERLLYVAAFAVAQFSGGRVKERSIRKPFNPLLGETYEMVRTDAEVPGGLRLLVEKVSHRPVRLVMQADAAAWSFAQAPAPSQKFWGKSAEIITEGRVRVVLRLPDGRDEKYSWAVATVFLRNVVVGEKYVEPVGTMHVVNESSGARAAVEFRSRGMFGGRSEDVHVEALDAAGAATGLTLTGTWTQALRLVDTAAAGPPGTEIWRVGPLVDDAAHVYGMTRFAATLNEITPLERGRMAPTDTRLRPDQRLAEEGRLDDAEVAKTRLEEAQRARRRELEDRGEEHQARWFVKVATGPDGDEAWRLKGGKDGYWEERARGTWTGVEDLFSG